MTPILSSTLLRTQSDARLLTLSREGNERAFEAIVERYRKPLLRHCRRLLSEAGAEDAVQQTFMRAWTAIQAGKEVRDLKAWLYRVAGNAAIDTVRRAGYEYDELSEALHLSPAAAEEAERRSVVRQTLVGLAALPQRQREALLATAVEGRSRAEVAADLGLSEGAVRQLVHRARSSMRAAATAITPFPLAAWAATLARSADPTGTRIAEAAAGASAGGVAGILVKGGAVAITAGVLATGTGGLPTHHHNEASASQPAAITQRDDRGGIGHLRRGDAAGHRHGGGRRSGSARDHSGRGGGHGRHDGGGSDDSGNLRSGLDSGRSGSSGSADDGAPSGGGEDHSGSGTSDPGGSSTLPSGDDTPEAPSGDSSGSGGPRPSD